MYSDLFPAELPPKLRFVEAGGALLTKAGVRGAPGVDDAQALLALAMRKEGVSGRVLDLQAMSGLLGLALEDSHVTLVERSAAALEVLHEQFDEVRAALPGATLEPSPVVALVLSGDRGNAHVEAMTAWASALTAPGGTLYLAGDKQKGFERYMKRVGVAFGHGEVIARDGGMRVARLDRIKDDVLPQPDLQTYTVEDLNVTALPGVFSSAGLDKASALLLRFLGEVQGRRVLDLGCGAGVLGAVAARRGAAHVTLLDDDLAAVKSARSTLSHNGLNGEVLHSDVGQALPTDERFDLVLSNPPFHVGRRVVLDVALEFVREAGERLPTGGEMRLVANDFLPYEAQLGRWGKVETLAREGGFKILRAVKR
ncbi:methyltransferase [Deinococcus peraridilitoris]|nr:methyltransferase [Deinococcus peraridilitoris]